MENEKSHTLKLIKENSDYRAPLTIDQFFIPYTKLLKIDVIVTIVIVIFQDVSGG